VKDLENKIKNSKQIRETELKNAEKEVKDCKKKMEESSKKMKTKFQVSGHPGRIKLLLIRRVWLNYNNKKSPDTKIIFVRSWFLLQIWFIIDD